jgi:hypothetical protein
VLITISPFVSDIDKSIRKHYDYLLRVDKKGSYRAFRYKKVYDADTHDRSKHKRFMDYFGLTLKAIPSQTWNKYEQFSFDQKEKIRAKREKDMIPEEKKKNSIINQIRGF